MLSRRKVGGRTCASDSFDEAGSATGNRDQEQLYPSFGSHVIHVKLLYAVFSERQRTSRIQPEVIVECDGNYPLAGDAHEQANECQQ